ncbi:MAG: acyl-ACP--UDP-N-acetylglucosamine O-acyltransferase [Gemmataceae bacterium]
MAIAKSVHLHPTAVIDPAAELGKDVRVGPFVVIDGPVRVGPGCDIRAGAHLFGHLTLGEGNVVHSHAVLGDAPQHLKFSGEPTRVEIGDFNTFREGVTVHRAAQPGGATRIGNRNFFMAYSHIAHDCVVGNNCVLANSAVVAGHAVLENNVTLSGNSAVHQFCRVGRLALISGISGTTMDHPPFMIGQKINTICGVNVIGMRRAGISNLAIEAIRRAFHIIYRSANVLPCSLAQLERELGHFDEVTELLQFIRNSKRGITLDLDSERHAA